VKSKDDCSSSSRAALSEWNTLFKYFIVPIGYVGGYSMCFGAPGQYGGGVKVFWYCRT